MDLDVKQKKHWPRNNGMEGKKEKKIEQKVRKSFIPRAEFYSFTVYQMNKYSPVCSSHRFWHNGSFST